MSPSQIPSPSRDYDLSRHFVGRVVPARPKPRHLVLVNAGRFRSTMRCKEAAAAAVALNGDAKAPFAMIDPRQSLTYRDIRGVPWTDFPIVSAPAYRYHPLSIFNRFDARDDAPPSDTVPILAPDGHGGLDWRVEPLSSVMEDIRHVLIVTGGEDDAHWLLMARMLMRQVLGKATTVQLVAGGLSRPLDAEEVGNLGEEALPRERFDFCYRINFRVIAGKAVAQSLAERPDGPPDRWADWEKRRNPGLGLLGDWTAPSVEDLARRLDHPVALQALYAVRRAGAITLPAGSVRADGGVNLHVPHLYASIMPVDPLSRGTHAEVNWLWNGSGKHPPMSVSGQDVRIFTAGAYFGGFFEADESGLRLSRMGHIFLDALHPDCEDPDAPCRWNGMPSKKAEASVDRWMRRFFRKMKTRVNKLS